MDNKTSKDVVAKPKIHGKAEAKIRVQQEKMQAKRADVGKFVLAAALVAVGIYAYYALSERLPVYVLALFPVLGVVLAAAVVFFWSNLGRDLTAYVKGAVAELKKVVWPQRNETLRMTLFVLVFTAMLALFLWGVDSLISWLFFDVFMQRS